MYNQTCFLQSPRKRWYFFIAHKIIIYANKIICVHKIIYCANNTTCISFFNLLVSFFGGSIVFRTQKKKERKKVQHQQQNLKQHTTCSCVSSPAFATCKCDHWYSWYSFWYSFSCSFTTQKLLCCYLTLINMIFRPHLTIPQAVQWSGNRLEVN